MRSCSSSCSESRLRMNTWLRERRALLTSNEGFSVVAPMRVSVPDSTWGRSASCWALLKR